MGRGGRRALALYAERRALSRDEWPGLWHSHEMIFGFVSAALAGFILTAIPNWTGRLPVRGAPLAGLTLLWLLGRLAILASALFGLEWVALLDLLFPFALFFVVLREIVSGKNKRNFPVAILFGVLAFANVLFHAEGFANIGLSGHGWRLGLGVIIMLISVIGGRVVPSFTRNWLAKNGAAGAAPSRAAFCARQSCAAFVRCRFVSMGSIPRLSGQRGFINASGGRAACPPVALAGTFYCARVHRFCFAYWLWLDWAWPYLVGSFGFMERVCERRGHSRFDHWRGRHYDRRRYEPRQPWSFRARD